MISVYLPNIPSSQSNYIDTYTYAQLLGAGSSNIEYKLYSDSPLGVDGYKKRVRISDGFEETQPFLNGHLAPEGCFKTIFGGKWDGDEAYGFNQYAQAGRQHKLWMLYKYATSGNIEYRGKYYDNEWKTVAEYKFNANTLTWTKK